MQNTIEQGPLTTTNETIQPSTRQQNKLIMAFLTNNTQILGQEKVDDVKTEQRKRFLDSILDEGGRKKLQSLLRSIRAPFYTESEIPGLFNKVSENQQMLGIICFMPPKQDMSLTQRGSLTSNDLKNFVEKYPDPMALEEDIEAFFSLIEFRNSKQKREEYEKSFQNFSRIIYGKRQEYYEQIRLLLKEAQEQRERGSLHIVI